MKQWRLMHSDTMALVCAMNQSASSSSTVPCVQTSTQPFQLNPLSVMYEPVSLVISSPVLCTGRGFQIGTCSQLHCYLCTSQTQAKHQQRLWVNQVAQQNPHSF